MYVPFNQLPENSRIWVYQADRKLSPAEKQVAEAALKEFCEDWAAHGQSLKTSFSIEHDQFIILATDEDYEMPSGCSIDKSVRTLKDISSHLNVDFFDRKKIAFLDRDGVVVVYSLTQLKGLFESGTLKGDTITFNNLVPSKGDLGRNWRTTVEKSWLTKYLGDSSLASKTH